MSGAAGIFVIIELTGDLASAITRVQRVHDRKLAALWPPHVTLIGSSGAGPIVSDAKRDELLATMGPVAARTAPLTLRFGVPQRFPDRDIVILPLDPHGALRALHDALKRSGIRTHRARYPFTPHCTLTMYPPLARAREQQLLAMRFDQTFVVETLRVYLTRDPQPAKWLFDLPLGSAPASAHPAARG